MRALGPYDPYSDNGTLPIGRVEHFLKSVGALRRFFLFLLQAGWETICPWDRAERRKYAGLEDKLCNNRQVCYNKNACFVLP